MTNKKDGAHSNMGAEDERAGLLFLLWELGMRATEAGSRKKQKRLDHSVCEFTHDIHVI